MRFFLKYFFLFSILVFSNSVKVQGALSISNLSKQQTFYVNVYTETENGWEKINNGLEEVKAHQTIQVLLKKEYLENPLGCSVWTNKNDCLNSNRSSMKFSIDIDEPTDPLQINITDKRAYFGFGKELESPRENESQKELKKAFIVGLPEKYREQIPLLISKKYKYNQNILKNPKINEIKTLSDLYKPTYDKKFQEAQRYVKSIRMRSIAEGEKNPSFDDPKKGDWFFLNFPGKTREFKEKIFEREIQEPFLQDFDDVIKQISNSPEKDKQALIIKGEKIINRLVMLYKIHLMPKEKEIEKIVIKLLQACNKDSELKNAIYLVKVNPSPEKEIIAAREPRIVIYPSPGKNIANKVLEKLVDIFKDDEGSGVAPEYNQAVPADNRKTIVYWAQGNRDEKNMKDLSGYYDKPNKICYKKDIKKLIDPTAQDEDYYLNAPGVL